MCAGRAQRTGASRVRAVAPEACRRADNGVDFVARAFHESGIQLDIIETQEEALLALTGGAPLYDPPDDGEGYALLFDIGGGRTQGTGLRLDEAAGGGGPP